MARARRGTSTRVVITNIDRQARRLAKQQKHLEKEMQETVTSVVKTKPIRLADMYQLDPLTDTQDMFFEAYDNEDAEGYVLYGSAGTGKTTLAMYRALLDVLNPDTPYERIILIRSSVQSRQQGHLPGDADEKMAMFEAPYHAICGDLFNRKDAYEKMKDMGLIEFHSTSFLRGSTFNNSIIIFDEAQSATFHEIDTVQTRVGRDSKMIVCGDGAQNDLITSKVDISGFRDFIQVSMSMSEFRHFRFTSDDIVRSGFTKSWIIAKEKLGL